MSRPRTHLQHGVASHPSSHLIRSFLQSFQPISSRCFPSVSYLQATSFAYLWHYACLESCVSRFDRGDQASSLRGRGNGYDLESGMYKGNHSSIAPRFLFLQSSPPHLRVSDILRTARASYYLPRRGSHSDWVVGMSFPYRERYVRTAHRNCDFRHLSRKTLE